MQNKMKFMHEFFEHFFVAVQHNFFFDFFRCCAAAACDDFIMQLFAIWNSNLYREEENKLQQNMRHFLWERGKFLGKLFAMLEIAEIMFAIKIHLELGVGKEEF